MAKEAFDREIATAQPPSDWHQWVKSAASVEASVHGGMTGVADSTFYAPVHAYLARVHAPPEPRAAIDFLHGLAAWDFREAAPAYSVLLDAARAGDLWLDADMLRDGAVMPRLATHA